MDSEPGPSKPVLHTSDINALLDLKTEYLLRKKAAVSRNYSENFVNKTKNNILAITKQEKKAKEDMHQSRQSRIRLNEEELRKEEAERVRRKQILEEKASIYERMSRGEGELVHEDGTSLEFLVNFQQKKKELEDQAKVQDRSDTSTAADAQRHEEAANPLVVHYDHTEEKGRVFGPSHVPLPFMNEDERQLKIEEIKRISEETTINRAKRKKVLDAKKAADRERLNRLRARKGLPLLVASDEEDETEDTEAFDVDLDDIPLPPTENPQDVPSVKKPKFGEREWDKGKTGYTRWLTKQRDERDEEFAPPSSYYS